MIHEEREMQVMNMGQYAHGNQPIQHMIYLYDWSNQPRKAQYWAREVMNRLYKAAPDRCENCGVGGELIEERRPALTRTWVCTVCGLKIKSENAPEKCPKCESPAELFKAQKDGIARMRCSICGFEIEGDTAPDRCENCGVDGDMFEPVKN